MRLPTAAQAFPRAPHGGAELDTPELRHLTPPVSLYERSSSRVSASVASIAVVLERGLCRGHERWLARRLARTFPEPGLRQKPDCIPGGPGPNEEGQR